MGSEPRTYIVAVKREARASAPPDIAERLRAIPGLDVVGEWGGRFVVRAGAGVVEDVRRSLGAYCHIEEQIEHHRT